MSVKCPKCQTEYGELAPGKYRCECGTLFSVAADGSVSPADPEPVAAASHPQKRSFRSMAVIAAVVAVAVVVAVVATAVSSGSRRHPSAPPPASGPAPTSPAAVHPRPTEEPRQAGERRPTAEQPRAEKEPSVTEPRLTAERPSRLPAGDLTIWLPGDVRLEMVKVEPGGFTMSAPSEKSTDTEIPHHAKLTGEFYLGQTEVTQAQWRAVTGKKLPGRQVDDKPAGKVNWHEAMSFCNMLNAMGKAPKGMKFTLPTETQWEYAARGGRKNGGFLYSGSNDIDEVAWYKNNSGNVPHPVAQKKANELGLYDMSGNVNEWCLDDWNKDSSKAVPEFTRGNDRGGPPRAHRGGSFSSYVESCRCGSRGYVHPGFHHEYYGFRLALVRE